MKKFGLWALVGLFVGCWLPVQAGAVPVALLNDPPPDRVRPSATITTPISNSGVLISNFVPGYVKGTAMDNVGVTGLVTNLSRSDGNGGTEYWTASGWSSVKGNDTGGSVSFYGEKSVTWAWQISFPPFVALRPGRYRLEVAAYDSVGRGNYVSRGFNLVGETTRPQVRVTTPTPGVRLLGKDFIAGGVEGRASDDTGLANVTVKLYRIISGTKTYFDGTGWGSQPANVYCIIVFDVGYRSATWRLGALPLNSTLTGGSYYIQATAIDASGNTANHTVPFTIVGDTVNPVAAVTNPLPNGYVPVGAFDAETVRGTAADNVAVSTVAVRFYRTRGGVKEYWGVGGWGPAPVFAPISGTGIGTKSVTWNLISPGLPALNTGGYTVWVQATDGSGNVSTPVSRNFTVVGENIPPHVKVETPVANARMLAVNFNSVIAGTATDNSALANVTVKLYRVAGSTKSYFDGTGWGSQAVNLSCILVFSADFRSLTWLLNSAPPTETLVGGNYYIQATAIDASGNTGTTTSSFYIVGDSTSPAVTITNPHARQTIVAGDFDFDTVRGTATDNVGVANMIIKFSRTRDGVKEYWDGSSWTTTSSSAFGSFGIVGGKAVTWSMTPPGEAAFDTGTYDLWVQAKDAVGNLSAPANCSFYVVASHTEADTEKPIVTITNPASGKTVPDHEVDTDTVRGTATDNKRVLTVTVKFYRTRGGVKEYWSTGGWVTISVPAPITGSGFGTSSANWSLVAPGLSDLDAGIYTIWAQAEDFGGNLSAPVSRSFTVGHILVPKDPSDLEF